MTKEESIKEYYFRINKSIDYIKENLHEELSLEKLASLSNFSKFHFHRIFKLVTGITVNEFIKKAKIERALFFLMNNPSKTINEISIDCGFLSMSSFSRSFRELQKTTPSAWRESHKKSNIGTMNSNIGKMQSEIENYLALKLNNLKNSKMSEAIKLDFKIEKIEEFNVIYVRNLNIHNHESETFGKMFDQLFSWAAPRNLINFPETKALTVYRSNANLEGMLQADVCLSVSDKMVGEGLIGNTIISGGLYAIFHKEAPITECFKTWNYIYDVWFEENGYQPDNRNFFLSHLNDPKTHPENFHIIDIYIPIKLL
ncbi:AraC family transcriptional regulator [Flavobacterium sp. ANB]|uniref:AraC family transcriptional regulator n=1 Tax=unclassified Flavobacterium TaxID=196869 RepID=UPI0012B6FBDD|nr:MULTISPECIES: AraC family transcriptional regulator [unclassified Flavobacterium]MBF4515950.1 AraC family transcriptional regulator [Flavobacterium sp. ANB]MTD68952.1 helix-turn-helix domain-containing protein [Flavobacterium sp. LC2016-13]